MSILTQSSDVFSSALIVLLLLPVAYSSIRNRTEIDTYLLFLTAKTNFTSASISIGPITQWHPNCIHTLTKHNLHHIVCRKGS